MGRWAGSGAGTGRVGMGIGRQAGRLKDGCQMVGGVGLRGLTDGYGLIGMYVCMGCVCMQGV
ncbi:hypothetical protein BC567DRAFT_213818 [Phyllosticta citribraziliensis]